MSNLTGKTALVTGGTGGIGNAICTRLSDAGCKVITTYRNREKAEQWQQEHAGAGRDFSIISCDVGDYASCQSMAGQILADHGQVDILVNNAGLTRDKVFLKMTPGMWSDVIKADLDSTGLFSLHPGPYIEQDLDIGLAPKFADWTVLNVQALVVGNVLIDAAVTRITARSRSGSATITSSSSAAPSRLKSCTIFG